MADPKIISKEENLAEAARWLDKAIAFEADPEKPQKFVEMAFKKALDHENAAFAD